MKFDIVKYIGDMCNRYYEGIDSQEETIDKINGALNHNSWQNRCNNKKVTKSYNNICIVKANGIWYVHLDWCIEDSKDEDK